MTKAEKKPTFFDCHKVSSMVKNRRISELVAKNTTMSSEFSRTSWHENSCVANKIDINTFELKIFQLKQTKMHHQLSPWAGIRMVDISCRDAHVLISIPEFLP